MGKREVPIKERPLIFLDDNIKMYLKQIGCEDGSCEQDIES